jgi:hypothetical protein
VLIKKFFNVGFEEITVIEREPFGLDEISRYPLFASDFLEFLRRVVPEHRHQGLVFSIAVIGRKPGERSAPSF